MDMQNKTIITVQQTIHAPIEKVWDCWTKPEHITQWNNASDDWHTPRAVNDLKVGGIFIYRMEAKDRSFAFDFEGVYDAVASHHYIEYTIADGRKVKITFTSDGDSTKLLESFVAEGTHSVEIQQGGGQASLDNVKK